VQVDPIKPTFTVPGTKCLKLECDELLSSFAFKFNLRRYCEGEGEGEGGYVDASAAATASRYEKVGMRVTYHPAIPASHETEFDDCLLIVHARVRTHSPHPPPWPHTIPEFPFQLNSIGRFRNFASRAER
jgi:hypothetical protein